MRILLLGSGGREHAFAWKLSQSPACEALYIAPGNAGTQQHGTNLAINPNDFPAVKAAVLEYGVDMVICGPEEPLVLGIQDYFAADAMLKQVLFMGPSQAGAQLEGSKAFAKAFMDDQDIPTAAYREFTVDQLEDGLEYLEDQPAPYVLKADGLAAGKGVLILDSVIEAQEELRAMLEGKFGEASETVVVEEFLTGIEFSVFVFTDGKDYKVLPVAKDYKRIGAGDTGLNTGGMGSVSHPPFVDEAMMKKVEERIIKPTIEGLQVQQLGYRGVIFIGLISVEDEPFVIEYNCRMGDPETQSVFPRLKTDLVELCRATAAGELAKVEIEIDERAVASVILVAGGYPGSYEKGKVITGLENVSGSLVFHAGVREVEGQLLTNGGRVLAVTSYGDNFQDALDTSLANAAKIHFDGVYYRKDIGFDL
ncbi:phosphoribosylamine--glycine ligase [Lewinella sp. LCG006]|uniref:phosphoribosylamine--glycine ligase n=1 Tax=Lewinella sp. LCG006 TaxID=3231911 RepID=UPI00345F1E05